MKVTQYKTNGKAVKNLPLDELMDQMRREQKQFPVKAFREELYYRFRDTKCPFAEKLPVIVFSSAFRRVKKQVVMKNYNGIILLEVKNLTSTAEAGLLRKKAGEVLQTLAAFVGSGGHSLKVLVRFVLPDGSLPQSRDLADYFHAAAYRKAAVYYAGCLNREISLCRPALERGCRVTYDPDLYFNPEAIPFFQEQPLQFPSEPTLQEVREAESDPLQRLMPGYEQYSIIRHLFENSLADALTSFGGKMEGRTEAFLIRLSENCFRSGIPQEDAVRWVLMHSGLQPEEVTLRTVIGNVYRLGKSFGTKPCTLPPQTLVLQMEEFMKRRYEFRFNELKGEVEHRERHSFRFNFSPVDERVLNSISLNAQAEGLAVWDRDIKRYVHSDKIPFYNPIDDYLNNLPVWDGTDRIRPLADQVPTSTAEWRNRFYTWFLSMVAHWQGIHQTHANSTLPLLVGEQGCGKSTWCLNLLPPVLREFYTDRIDLSRRSEAEQYLNRFLLVNIDEFDSVSSHYQGFLKHVLQKPVVQLRRPYQQAIRRLKRYASFIGTCNHSDLLTDPSGSRRYLCVEISGTIRRDLPLQHDQLYAQALHALATGQRYWFTPEEEAEITRQNSAFQQLPPAEQLFLRYFRAAEPGEENVERLSAVEILERIRKRCSVQLPPTTLTTFGRLLQKNKVSRIHTAKGNLYLVAEVI